MQAQRYLGVEIGGTKLQLGVGDGDSTEFIELVREDVIASAGAEGILRQLKKHAPTLCARHKVQGGVGIGFGGPVNVVAGRTTRSHQIDGWEDVPLREMFEGILSLPVNIDNDCNVAALAEARLGAGQGASRVFYVTVGTGIGGGFVVNGCVDGNCRPAISEIGHLRPGTSATQEKNTVESVASGWGIAAWTQQRLCHDSSVAANELRDLCAGNSEALTTKQIGAAAIDGNAIAREAIQQCTMTLGWAIGQVVTLLAPDIVVVGGGVSLLNAEFFEPLRHYVACYAFPPLANSYQIRPAQLGEEVVVHGAIQIAAAERSMVNRQAKNASE